MEWGPHIDFLKGLAAGGDKTAANRLKSRPILHDGLKIYLTAFQELSYDRPVGMAMGHIPWSSIDRWAERHGIAPGEDFNILVSHVRSLEAAFDKASKAKNNE